MCVCVCLFFSFLSIYFFRKDLPTFCVYDPMNLFR